MNRLNLCLLAALLVAGCSGSGDTDTPAEKETDRVDFTSYLTTGDGKRLMEKGGFEFGNPFGVGATTVTIDKTETFQTIDGFGAAVTGATAYNLMQMSSDARKAVLTEIFSRTEGLGSSLVRVSIGASDFSVNDEFTWCDKAGLENFAVHKEDSDWLFPVLKEIYAINPDVKIIASPWSAPLWMKCDNLSNKGAWYQWTSGQLNPDHYADYAEYFVKWIQTMEAEGFNIYAMTVQNEPLNRGNSMSMYMTWQEQRDFIRTALGPAFKKAGIKTKILVFDHNYNYDDISDQRNYPLNIYADEEASAYVAGSAWHNYGGSVTELKHIASGAPDKEIYFTEASIGTWNYDFKKCLYTDFNSIFIQTMLYGGKGVTLWNMILDSDKGPHRGAGACSTCYGAMTMAKGGAITERTTHYYDIAHASKVILPGAVRVGASGSVPSGISYAAFKNPDGSMAVIIANSGSSAANLVFKSAEEVFISIPAQSIASLIWNE